MATLGDTARLRALTGRALVGGLCVAAAAAIISLVSGSFDETEVRVVVTSLGFSLFSSTGAAGGALRLREAPGARALGSVTAGVSAVAFVLLLALVWVEAGDDDLRWRAFGVAALMALWTSHASLVLRGLQPRDAAPLRWLTLVSIVTLGIDTAAALLAVLGVVDDVTETAARVLSALLVVSVLSTALVPILRRLAATSATPADAPAAAGFGSTAPPRGASGGGLAWEVAESARRLGEMDLPAPARAEVSRLGELARAAGAE